MVHYQVDRKIEYTAVGGGAVDNSATTGEIIEVITEPEATGTRGTTVQASEEEPPQPTQPSTPVFTTTPASKILSRIIPRTRRYYDNIPKSIIQQRNINMKHTHFKFRPASRRNEHEADPMRTGPGHEPYRSSPVAGPSTETYPSFVWQDYVLPGTELKYIRYERDVDKALKSVKGPFGFDVEWKPRFTRGQAESPIALIQLAQLDRILLIQLTAMDVFPSKLRDILEDRRIVKAGVGIAGDAKKLWLDYGVSLLGAVELSRLARVTDPPQWAMTKATDLISLARLVKTYKLQQLSKSQKVRLSNWEMKLNPKQMDYAASDALAGFVIYQHLVGLGSGALPQDYTFNFIAGKSNPYVQAPESPQGEPRSGDYDVFALVCSVFGLNVLYPLLSRQYFHHKMSLRLQPHRILRQIRRELERSHHHNYIKPPRANDDILLRKTYNQFPQPSTIRPFCSEISSRTGPQTPFNWKVLGVVGFAGLTLHAWLQAETYALEAQFPHETEKEDPATSIAFPTILKLEGEPEMTLLGLGVRTVSFLGIRVYSVAFYADLSKTLRQCKNADECVELLIRTTSCALRIVPTRATSHTHLRDGFVRALQARQALRRKDGSLGIEQEEALHISLQQFKGLFPATSFKKHQPLHMVLSSPDVKPRQLRIPLLGAVQDTWIATEFFLAYFQGTISPPLIEDVKQNIESMRLVNTKL
ncbi:Chalcone domain-containing protein [Ceratobasidium theobromae]|uniref:Chalcone domain-containing protein n=1 Tax=Ceratobasidium theobromae TaxID=1582974 RepID=A0A5N5QM77_9AGAM|nr:Chalcone domain-containing protein [Ceratobasidium theobromae]